MGYRSDVAYTIRFDKVEDYHLFILEAKANPATAGCFPPNNTGSWEECTCNEKDKRIDFHATSVKWYESYPDVQMHEKLIEQAEAWCYDDDHTSVKDNGEITVDMRNYRLGFIFVRIGEDDDDNERREGGETDYSWLSICRSIEGDFPQ